jgi:hypothetical protein
MGKKEDPIIDYCSGKKHFASLLNGWMFGGKVEIQPSQVHSDDSRYTSKVGRRRTVGYRSRYRDILKKVNGVHIRLMVGVEVQSYIDYAMPARVMDYDSVEYSRQIAAIRQENMQKNPRKVPLSSLTKFDRLTPALTLVLYIGQDEWDAAQNLHGILDFSQVSEEWKPYIADYPLHVLDVCHESDERLKEFPDDLACLFLILKYQKNKQELLRVVQDIQAFQHVDEDLYDTIWAYTNENELLQLKENYSDGGEINMCQAIRELVEDSRQEGIEIGIRALVQTLCELEVSEKNITDTVVRKFEVSEADAIAYVNKYSN